MGKETFEERISLRRITRNDLEYFYLWASDPEVAKTMTWNAYNSRNEAEKFLKEIAEKHPWFKAICLDGIPVGSITLTQGKGDASCRAELGYVLSREHWGKGIATLAAQQAIKVGFDDLGIERIEALVAPDNVASRKVLIKSGMSCEGLLRSCIVFKSVVCDRYIYSITRQ